MFPGWLQCHVSSSFSTHSSSPTPVRRIFLIAQCLAESLELNTNRAYVRAKFKASLIACSVLTYRHLSIGAELLPHYLKERQKCHHRTSCYELLRAVTSYYELHAITYKPLEMEVVQSTLAVADVAELSSIQLQSAPQRTSPHNPISLTLKSRLTMLCLTPGVNKLGWETTYTASAQSDTGYQGAERHIHAPHRPHTRSLAGLMEGMRPATWQANSRGPTLVQ